MSMTNTGTTEHTAHLTDGRTVVVAQYRTKVGAPDHRTDLKSIITTDGEHIPADQIKYLGR